MPSISIGLADIKAGFGKRIFNEGLYMNVLFIGGTGQISLECVHEAVRQGYDISIFNRGLRNTVLLESVKVIQGDFDDLESYSALADYNFDVVCQFIAYEAKDVARDIELFAGKVRQYIFISSASAYIKPPQKVITTEDTPLDNKYWDYSRKKAECEAVLREQDVLPYTIVRPSHTVRTSIPTALAEKEVAVYRILNNKPVIVPGDGSSLWTLTHVRDFAPPFVKLFGRSETIGEAYNLTSSNAYRWDEIYQALGRVLGVDDVEIVHVATDTLVRYNPAWSGGLLGDKIWTSLFGNSKIKSVVGDFECNTTLDELMRLAVEESKKIVPTNSGEDKDMNALFDRIIADQEVLGE